MENLATQLDGQVLTVKITGRLDTSNAQACATELLPQLEGDRTAVCGDGSGYADHHCEAVL